MLCHTKRVAAPLLPGNCTCVNGIDVDPTAISTANATAHLNKIDNINFQLGDVRRWKSVGAIEVVTANLSSELLIEILPKLKRSNWLMLSGILRAQEKEFVRALRRHKIEVVEVRRRGKWIAVLAKSSASVPPRRRQEAHATLDLTRRTADS